MVRKKVGKEHDVDYWIIQCLGSGEKTLGNIREFLRTKKIMYADNTGLLLRLQSLIDEGRIDKHKSKENSYPTYYLTEQELEKISFQARVFASHASRKLLLSPISKTFRSQAEEFIEKMILRCGFYVLYATLQGWKLALQSESDKDRKELLGEWLENAFPMPFVPTYFHQQLSEILDPKKEFELDRSPFSEPAIRKLGLEKIEIMLKALYSEEMRLCNVEMKNLKDTAKKTLDNKIEYEIATKNIKNLKKKKN